MGRAIVRKPKAFLMDEPLSNLDAKLRVQMRGEIARLQKRLGTTTVYVTHDQTEAMTLGDRVVVLKDGVAQQIGTPDQLYNHPANLFVAGFIGSPAMNFFPATAIANGIRLPFGELTVPVPAGASGDLVVGVRPESFEDASLLDGFERVKAVTFGVEVNLVESLGSDKYAYFSVPGVDGSNFVARLSAESTAAIGQPLELALDPAKLHIFDAASGVNLTA